MEKREELRELEAACGYTFHNTALLEQAMRHSSRANETGEGHAGSNERLEFLGDAVLEMLSSEYLYAAHPDMPEGDLTQLRAALVCEPTLAADARCFGLPRFLELGRGEEKTGGRERDSVVSDALEALLGAIYLDGGLEPARSFVRRFVMDDMEHKKLFYDSKTSLQELLQGTTQEKIRYVEAGESGPPHNRTFSAEVYLGEKLLGAGSGKSKKAAEQQAAREALKNVSEKH